MATYRKLDKLNPDFRKKVELFMEEMGDVIFITESWRSQERQNALYAIWRTVPWEPKTRTLNSLHTKGLAIDVAFNHPYELYPKQIELRNRVYDVAEKYGIVSLYRKYWIDKPHLEDNFIPLQDDMYEITEDKKRKLIRAYMDLWSTLYDIIDTKAIKNLLNKINDEFRKVGIDNK